MSRFALFIVTSLLLAGYAFGYEVTGYYYTGTINGTLPVQMGLDIDGSEAGGTYQYVSRGQFLSLLGSCDARDRVELHETEYLTPEHETGTFTGALTDKRHRFTGTWRSADGKRAFPFRLQAVAEYRRLTKTIKLAAEEAKGRTQLGKTPDRIITETVPYFYQATPALSLLNRQLWDRAVAELKTAEQEGKAETDSQPCLGTLYAIQYLDTQLLSLSAVVSLEGGAHDFISVQSKNYLLGAPKPVSLTWDDLLTGTPELRAALLDKIRARARKLADNDQAGIQPFTEGWDDLPFALNARRLTVYYPSFIGILGSYDVELPYTELVPYLSEKSVIRRYLKQ